MLYRDIVYWNATLFKLLGVHIYMLELVLSMIDLHLLLTGDMRAPRETPGNPQLAFSLRRKLSTCQTRLMIIHPVMRVREEPGEMFAA